MGCNYEETNVPSGKTPRAPGLEVLKRRQIERYDNGHIACSDPIHSDTSQYRFG
jgi:hypothetical protein